MDDKLIGEYSRVAGELTAQAESDRDAQVKRLIAAGASPLMVDALIDVARKEMWSVLFAHLIDVAVQEARGDHGHGLVAYNDGRRAGIEMCIRNVFQYVTTVARHPASRDEYVQVRPVGKA